MIDFKKLCEVKYSTRFAADYSSTRGRPAIYYGYGSQHLAMAAAQ
jgi:hypothetical protein